MLTSIVTQIAEDIERIQPCGPTTVRLVRQACNAIHSDSLESLSTLLALANDHINAVDYHAVQKHWLALYTDVSILLSIADLYNGEPSRLRAAVRRLDMATIIAGGVDREDTIAQLLRHVQTYLPRRTKTSISANTILEIPAPSMEQYLQHCSHPFIIRGHCEWPAMEKWKSADYLLDQVGEGRVVPVEIGQAYSDDDWGQRIISFRTLLAQIGFDVEPEDDAPPGPLYLAQHSLFKQFPVLQRDIMYPDYVWSDPPRDDGHDPLDEPVTNVWIGNSANHPISPAHTDPHFNCYTQVLGSKRVWLAPPSVGSHMYTHDTHLSNTSTVPIFRSDDIQGYPDFFEKVVPLAQEATLHPGDLLVMPPGWWHAMKGQGSGPGWSISMWY